MKEDDNPTAIDRIDTAIARIKKAVAARNEEARLALAQQSALAARLETATDEHATLVRQHEALRNKVGSALAMLDDILAKEHQ